MNSSKNDKSSSIKFKHANDNFDAEAAKELGIDPHTSNVTTAKIIYAYELGLNNKL